MKKKEKWREIGCLALIAVAGVVQADVFGTRRLWDAETAARVAQSRRQTADGRFVYGIQTDGKNAACPGCYAALLEANVIPREDLVSCACFFLDGTEPCMCGTTPCDRDAKTIDIAYLTWRKTNTRAFIESKVLDKLVAMAGRLPRTASLMDSVAAWQALGRAGDMLTAGGRGAEGAALQARRAALAETVSRTLWDDAASLYRTEKGGVHDVWGSAYAVWTGLAPSACADAVARRFRDAFSTFVVNGAIRRTPSAEDGASRVFPLGWFAWTLERAAPDLTDRLFRDVKTGGRSDAGCDFLCGAAGMTESLARLCRARAAAAKPVLHGDGVTDDTAAIQMMLDAGRSCVYLPPPEKFYLISKALELDSGQELRLDRNTLVKLAPKSDCHMLVNRNWRTGDRNIAVIGGVWDLDCARQSPNPHQGRFCKPPRKFDLPKSFQRDFFRGEIFCFDKLEGLVVRDVTFRNPTTYSLQMTRTSYFVIDGIVFDFDSWNPIPLNMDGIHCDGGCHHGKISNLRGTCFDDLVALNANDGICAAYEGPITDIDIDGIYAEYCHSAVRLLSAGADLKRVTIRNVHGKFYTYTVGLTHYFPEKPRGRFEDIVLSDIFSSKVSAPEGIGVNSRRHYPPIWVEGPVDVGSLTIRNMCRDESEIPVSSIRVDKVATVENLTIRDCRMRNELDCVIPFFDLRGKVENIVSENNLFIGNWMNLPQKGVVR